MTATIKPTDKKCGLIGIELPAMFMRVCTCLTMIIVKRVPQGSTRERPISFHL